MLNPAVRKDLFGSGNKILTHIMDSVPTIYNHDSTVVNSLVADGCVIGGQVENSIIFRDVKVKKGATVKNSILMQGTVIEPGAAVDHFICDKAVTVTAGQTIGGSTASPMVVGKGQTV